MGFLLHPEDVLAPSDALLRQAPACPPKPEVLDGVCHRETLDTVARAARPFRVTGLSKSNLLGQLSRRF
jgi:hypothetical protein